MRKISLGILLLSLLFTITNVYAEEYFYVNENGLGFTAFQYDAMVKTLGLENVIHMDKETYDEFDVPSYEEGKYEIIVYEEETPEEKTEDGISTCATVWETASKRLTIMKNCSSSACNVRLTCIWKSQLKVRSYDVIGFRLSSTNFASNTITSAIEFEGKTYFKDGEKKTSNGVGHSFKLRTNDFDYTSIQIQTAPKGAVYGSYQHATKTVSLNQSLSFTFGGGGYGGVFVFPDSLSLTYDGMGGVVTTLP